MKHTPQSVTASTIATEAGVPETDVLALVDQLAAQEGTESVVASDTGGRVALTLSAAAVIRAQLGATQPGECRRSGAVLAIGTRVRTLIDLTSAAWAPEQPDIPAGSLGTVDHVHYVHNDPTKVAGYGVMLDDSVDRLSAWMGPADVEAAPMCTATFAPPSAEAMPCVLAPHPHDPNHETAPVGDRGEPWRWRDGAPGAALPVHRFAEARDLKEGDRIEHHGRHWTVASVWWIGDGATIFTTNGGEIYTDPHRIFETRRDKKVSA